MVVADTDTDTKSAEAFVRVVAAASWQLTVERVLAKQPSNEPLIETGEIVSQSLNIGCIYGADRRQTHLQDFMFCCWRWTVLVWLL